MTIFLWFSNDGRLAVVVFVAAVLLILFILVIVGVPRRHRGVGGIVRMKCARWQVKQAILRVE